MTSIGFGFAIVHSNLSKCIQVNKFLAFVAGTQISFLFGSRVPTKAAQNQPFYRSTIGGCGFAMALQICANPTLTLNPRWMRIRNVIANPRK